MYRSRSDGPELKGNDVFEGYSADLAQEIAERIGFHYRLQLVQDGKYGTIENSEWNGMVGELIYGVRNVVSLRLFYTHAR